MASVQACWRGSTAAALAAMMARLGRIRFRISRRGRASLLAACGCAGRAFLGGAVCSVGGARAGKCSHSDSGAGVAARAVRRGAARSRTGDGAKRFIGHSPRPVVGRGHRRPERVAAGAPASRGGWSRTVGWRSHASGCGEADPVFVAPLDPGGRGSLVSEARG